MAMNDGCLIMDDYGTVVYPPRGEDNRHTVGEPGRPYVDSLTEVVVYDARHDR